MPYNHISGIGRYFWIMYNSFVIFQSFSLWCHIITFHAFELLFFVLYSFFVIAYKTFYVTSRNHIPCTWSILCYYVHLCTFIIMYTCIMLFLRIHVVMPHNHISCVGRFSLSCINLLTFFIYIDFTIYCIDATIYFLYQENVLVQFIHTAI